MVHGIAIALFVSLFAFGRDYFQWGGHSASIQTALFASFLFGILAAFKSER